MHDGTAYFAAGRHSDLDGGIFVYGVEATSGKLLWRQQAKRTSLCDVPVTNGKFFYIQRLMFDLNTGKEDRSPDRIALRAPTLGRAEVGGQILSFRNDRG